MQHHFLKCAFEKSLIVHSLRAVITKYVRVPVDTAAHGVTKLELGLGLIGHKGWI